MMHLNFDLRPPADGKPFTLEDINLETDDISENRLHELCAGNLLDIINPCIDFAKKFKAGEFDKYDKKHVALLAEIDNFISDIWCSSEEELESGDCSRNIFILFVRLLSKCITLKQENEKFNSYLSAEYECMP